MRDRRRPTSNHQVFVTVGTTSFDALIKAMSSPGVLQCLYERGYRKLMLQIGAGHEPIIPSRHLLDEISWYSYKDNLRPDMSAADLIISHAGAGSIMEALELGRCIIVVVNTALMDDHQQELASILAEQKHLFATSPAKVETTLREVDFRQLRPRPMRVKGLLAQAIDEEMRSE